MVPLLSLEVRSWGEREGEREGEASAPGGGRWSLVVGRWSLADGSRVAGFALARDTSSDDEGNRLGRGSRVGRTGRGCPRGRESIFLFRQPNEFCGKAEVALEAGVAGAGLESARRACEGAGRGSGPGSRVGKFWMAVKRRGSPSGRSSAGAAAVSQSVSQSVSRLSGRAGPPNLGLPVRRFTYPVALI
jgi:hypothetical protein